MSLCLARKCYSKTLFLIVLLETGPPFYAVIQATRRSSRLQGKGSTAPLFLSYFKTTILVRPQKTNQKHPSLQ